MERIQSINPQRVQWCCDDRGVTPEALASAVGIAWPGFEKMLAGEDGLTFNQLRRVANYFNRGVLFFLEPEAVDEARVHTPQFRTLANQKPELSAPLKALIERVERQRAIYLSLREDLGAAAAPLPAPPGLPRQTPRQTAAVARAWLGLGETNDFNGYREAVEGRGILVFRSNGYQGLWRIPKESLVCGFSLYHPVCPVIVVKKQDAESRQVFTLMHELGHVLLHQNSFIDEEADLYSHQGQEREANAFAGHLLVPDVFLEGIADADRPDDAAGYDDWLKPYRDAWGVSGEVILRRLMDAGRLPQTEYERYRRWRSQLRLPEKTRGSRKYRHREPRHVFGEPYVRTVLDALHADQITLAKASTYLDNLKVEDIHRLENTYAHL